MPTGLGDLGLEVLFVKNIEGLEARVVTQSSDSIQQLAPVAQFRDVKLLEVLRRQICGTISPISLSRNAASYLPRPRLRSQTKTSVTAPKLRRTHIIVQPGWRRLKKRRAAVFPASVGELGRGA